MLISCLKHETQAAVLNTAFIICDSKKRDACYYVCEKGKERRDGERSYLPQLDVVVLFLI